MSKRGFGVGVWAHVAHDIWNWDSHPVSYMLLDLGYRNTLRKDSGFCMNSEYINMSLFVLEVRVTGFCLMG